MKNEKINNKTIIQLKTEISKFNRKTLNIDEYKKYFYFMFLIVNYNHIILECGFVEIFWDCEFVVFTICANSG